MFVVRKVTWRPAGEALPTPDPTAGPSVPNGVSLPLEEMNLYPEPGVLDGLIEQGKREYYEEKAAEEGRSPTRPRDGGGAMGADADPAGRVTPDGVALRERSTIKTAAGGRQSGGGDRRHDGSLGSLKPCEPFGECSRRTQCTGFRPDV